NVGVGSDDTLFATSDGIVYYETVRDNRKRVSVITLDEYSARIS
ncbi:MAG: 50S ribosomal protein L27, partial [Anaerolineales bacterium]